MSKNHDKMNNMYDLFATTYAFYLLIQKYHWNIQGSNFYMMHKFLEDIYEELAKDIDEIAECIRAMDYSVPATFAELQKLSAIQDHPNIESDSLSALKLIYKACETLRSSIIKTVSRLTAPEEEGANSLLTDILQKKDKMAWLIKSHII